MYVHHSALYYCRYVVLYFFTTRSDFHANIDAGTHGHVTLSCNTKLNGHEQKSDESKLGTLDHVLS